MDDKMILPYLAVAVVSLKWTLKWMFHMDVSLDKEAHSVLGVELGVFG